MKINNLLKAFSLLLIVAFAACSDFEDTELISPDRPAGNQGVFFPTTNVAAHELEPTDPTQITVTISRAVSSGSASIPVTVVTNDDDVFNVPATADFADGETETDLVVTFPNADEGVTYNLALAVEGEQAVDPYGAGAISTATQVTRIKWESVDDPLIYMDGTFSGVWGTSKEPVYVEAERAQLGASVKYRLKNVYKYTGDEEPDADGIYNGFPHHSSANDFDNSKDWFTVIEIHNATGASGDVSMELHEIGVDWGGYGMISIGSQVDKFGTLSNNKITFPDQTLAFYDDDGGYNAQTTVIYLTKEAFIADNMRIDDFNDVEYVEIEGELGEFESLAYGETWSRTLSAAIDIDSLNDASEYKNLFYLEDLYADNHGFAFYYNDETGAVSIPENQQIGREVFGKDLYVSQSESNESSVEVNYKGTSIYTFGLIFHFNDGTIVGDFIETFYYNEDALVYDKDDFLGEFSLTGGTAAMDVEIEEKSTNNFAITGITNADEVNAVFNPTNITLSISPQILANVTLGENIYEAEFDILKPSGSANDATLDFEFNLRGNLVVSDTSVGTGFGIYGINTEDEENQGYLSRNTSPVFLPIISEIVEPETQGVANFSIQGKKSTDRKRIVNR